ncbi:hypothetical protein M408DRAFT_288243 [Serendipita vermifera MAFF 305830]|uniref:Uncharacterized protein n=1 Tax=Serendipita vermifera MAFF 305830 TaxID=933852 RepID=A0A0C2WWZ7_SERVB|nr:hypothetical protein M408DRAFT_288243 [Serendipita vermifera MAFF 305830]
MATAVPCGGRDNEANGCRKLFPKLAGDVCHKCKRAKRTTSAEERNLVLMMSQCSSCGISGDFVTDPCGECMNCASILDAERADRSQHMLARMTPRGSMPSPRPATSLNSLNASVILSRHTPSMPTSSQRQSTILRGTTMVTALFKPTTIGFRPVSSGTDFCSRIGRFEIQIAETATISDLRAQAVARINTKWTETNITGFQETDCDLRFPGNVAFEPADMLLTVKEFLKLLAPGGARFTQWIASDLPGYKTMKKHTYINSEIQVDYSSYQIRQEEIDEQSDGTGPSTKMSFRLPRRSLITSQVKSNLGKRKHSLDSMRPPQPLRSSFAPFGSLAQPTRTHHESLIVPPPPPPSVATPPRTDTPSEIVFFHIMTCIIDPETFEPTYTEETGELKEAMIGKLPMVLARKDAGITKDVYKVSLYSL